MPITPGAFKFFTKRVTFFFADNDVTITYYPAAFGAEAQERWNTVAAQANAAQDADSEQAAALAFGALICGIVASWDYCEDPQTPDGPPGPPVPLTPERLLHEFMTYPLFFPEFLRAIIEAIAADVYRGNANGTTSPATSDATSLPAANSTISPVESSQSKSDSSLLLAGSVVVAQLSIG